MSEMSGNQRTRRVEEAEGARRTLVELDRQEALARIVEAFHAFIPLGFEVHLVGVQNRGDVEYKLLLQQDGLEEVEMSHVQKIAETFGLAVFFERDRGLALYPRWASTSPSE